MQQFKSHKVVEAAKITGVYRDAESMGYILRHGPDPLDFIGVADEWIRKHAPRGDLQALVGGYVVSYPDAYLSWSPAEAFEEGYTALVHDPKDGALPVSGYKPQTSANVEVVNGNKAAEEATLRILDLLESYPGVDRRWLAIGRTSIEQGWMAVNRAVFKPGRVTLPEDAA